MRWLSLVPLTLVLAACEPADTDGDGLYDEQEIAWGSDINNVDSDGDGLSDGDEVWIYNTHPAYVDSDSDGMTDDREIALGFDPRDPASRGYIGGWPVALPTDKAALERQGPAPSIEADALMPRFSFWDQHGERVDTYDFHGDGKFIVFDVAAEWCGPCQDLSAYMAGAADAPVPFGSSPGYTEAPDVRTAINAGDVYWISVLADGNSAPADKALPPRWDAAYPNEHIPVLADPGKDIPDWINLTAWPSLFMVDENMRVVAGDLNEALNVLKGAGLIR